MNSRLVKRNGHRRGAGVPRRKRRDVRRRRSRRSSGHLEAAIPFATAADGRRAPRADQVVPHGRTGRSDGVRRRMGQGRRSHRSIRSTASSRCTWTREAIKGAWEAIVFYVNHDKTEGIRKLAAAAQWFEDRMPWDPRYRKHGVHGITANAIDVVVETGDSGPVTPVGINLPNDQTRTRAVRQQVGLADQRPRCLRAGAAGVVPQRVRVDARGGGTRPEVGRVCRRADDEHA